MDASISLIKLDLQSYRNILIFLFRVKPHEVVINDWAKRLLLRERSRKDPLKSRRDLHVAGKESELGSVAKAILTGEVKAVG